MQAAATVSASADSTSPALMPTGSNRKTWTDKDHDEATAKADRISMRAYGLAQVLKVCAFAAEARRTLTDIEDALVYRDKAREDLRNHVYAMTNWAELRDTSGDALEFVAQEMAAAMEESVDLIYGLASRLSESDRVRKPA